MPKNKTRRGIAALSQIFVAFLTGLPAAFSQQTADSILQDATLPNVIKYALENQPAVQQSLIDETITKYQVKSKLADWYPQVNFNYLYQHTFKVQSSVIGGNVIHFGVNNNSALQFTVSQNIFDRDVLLANRTKKDVFQQSQLQTGRTKIDVVAEVSKAFYALLATEEQIKVSDENIVRLQRSLKDARARYDAGIVDKTDYKRATISLNNAVASKKANEELLKARTEYLKSLMNYPDSAELNIVYDSTALQNEVYLDTLQEPDYAQRIEYQILENQKRLLEANVQYNKWSFIPSLSANAAYNFNYLNNDFGKLYNKAYPNSYAGVTFAFPIFQGGKRKYNIREAEWELQRTDWELIKLKNSVNAEYSSALANYKSNLAFYLATKENVDLAQEVYEVISLQYNAGVKTYLEVIVAESDLRTARINYFNALYEVLSSKIDAEKSLGLIRY